MTDTPDNEIMAEARKAKRSAREASKRGERHQWPLAVGIGVGVGSAALAAVLLYTKTGRKG